MILSTKTLAVITSCSQSITTQPSCLLPSRSNKSLCAPVGLRPLPADYQPTVETLPGVFRSDPDDQEDEAEEEAHSDEFKSADQLGAELITLSLLPESRWKSLLHLDTIKVTLCLLHSKNWQPRFTIDCYYNRYTGARIFFFFLKLLLCRKGISLWCPLLRQLLRLSSCQQFLVSPLISCRLKILRKKPRCSVESLDFLHIELNCCTDLVSSHWHDVCSCSPRCWPGARCPRGQSSALRLSRLFSLDHVTTRFSISDSVSVEGLHPFKCVSLVFFIPDNLVCKYW